MQAFSRWTDPVGTLGIICQEALVRATTLETRREELEFKASQVTRVASMSRALRQPTVALLAEVKRRSPSKGMIAEGLDAVAQARAYASAGAAAISILTEPAHFGGSARDLLAVRDGVAIPVLKKDFHVRPIQLLEAKALGASAALIIARALSPDWLPEMMSAGRRLGLDLLVEVRDEEELDR
ncbi:MAG: trpC, partial [Gemmatimonadetes bacterium]|nr:trpC [Gemmatimonadota bacterium]